MTTHEITTHVYLRASTDDQDATRARDTLNQFAQQHQLVNVEHYVENFSGAKLERPQLIRLIAAAKKGDFLLVESIDRLTRLPAAQYEALKARIEKQGLRVVVVDLPTSHDALKSVPGDRIIELINGLMMDIAAHYAHEDYTKRRQRQAQGIAKAKAENKYKGRPADTNLRSKIESYLTKGGNTYAEIAKLCDCSVGMVAKVKKILETA
ncbi:TPA: recombinase family protein [Klebsiella oxytoca]|uniref:recombinase family protein n=1 Tax=Klebsiella oxytoca TaxID=571 RepID=UPI0013234947|nr:recombinase family protein [Klebsiella oxytoca]MXS12058.1 recombinase family protein [Klebsiella oxytoca]HCK6979081.1 recombinase family protein [Klebsiella oxytoca]HCK6990706.1 recombinase family protein [Klebsiella oxytoca]